MIASISAVSSVSPVSRGSSRSGAASAAAVAAPATTSSWGAGPGPASGVMGHVVEASLMGPAELAESRDTTPLRGIRDISQEAAKMPENTAADTMKREIASTESQPAGAVYSVKKIAVEAETEMKDREPTPIEILKEQQAGGKPGGNVDELNALIEQTSPLAQKVDLAETRPDAPIQNAEMRKVAEQALAQGRAERGTSLTEKPNAQEQMQQQLNAAQSRESAYSTLSLAAVSSQAQQGRKIRLTM